MTDPTTKAADTPHPRRRGCFLKAAMLVGTPILMLLVIEGVWQLVGDPRVAANEAWLQTRPDHFRLAGQGMLEIDPDAAVSFRMKPGFEATVDGNRYRINAHGMRGGPIAVEKPAGTRRVLVLGDSYAFGFGVAEDATIASQLQMTLSSAGEKVEVLNMGVPGYQTGQQLRVLSRDGLRFSPDLVVLVYYANDNVTASFHYDPVIGVTYVDELPLPRRVKQACIRSILYAKLAKAYTGMIGAQLDSLGENGRVHNWPTTKQRLTAIADLCKARGIPLVMVAIPGLDTSKAFVDPNHAYNTDHDRVLAQAARLSLPTVDVRLALMHWSLGANAQIPKPALASPTALRAWVAKSFGQDAAKVTPELLFQGMERLKIVPKPIESSFVKPEQPRKDSHLNREGYAVIVRELAALIEKRGLVK